jgi:hypothetical protein
LYLLLFLLLPCRTFLIFIVVPVAAVQNVPYIYCCSYYCHTKHSLYLERN